MTNFHKIKIGTPSGNCSHPDWERELEAGQASQPDDDENALDLEAEIDRMFMDSDDEKCGVKYA